MKFHPLHAAAGAVLFAVFTVLVREPVDALAGDEALADSAAAAEAAGIEAAADESACAGAAADGEAEPAEGEAVPAASATDAEAAAWADTIRDTLALLEAAEVELGEADIVLALRMGLLSRIPSVEFFGREEYEALLADLRGPEEGETVQYEILPNRLGYIRVARCPADAIGALDEAFGTMEAEKIEGIVVDLRGTAGLAPELMEQAEARRVKLETFGPVIVLVDENTRGDGEELAARWALHAAVVGRATRGELPARRTEWLADDCAAAWVETPLAVGTKIYDGTHGVEPDVQITAEMEEERVFEPEQPRLRKGKTLSDEEKEDRALRDRTRNDAALRYATDILLGLRAVSGMAR
jgi:hypothetical protein